MSSHAISIFISYESWETVKSGLQLFSQSPFGVFSSKMPHCFIVYKKKIPWCLQPSIKVHLLWWLFSLFFSHLVWPAACCTETAGKTAATERSFMPLLSKPILEIKLGQQVLVARIAYQYITRLFNSPKKIEAQYSSNWMEGWTGWDGSSSHKKRTWSITFEDPVDKVCPKRTVATVDATTVTPG